MSNTKKTVSEHRLFVLSALERLENGELATLVLKDAPVESHRLCQEILLGVQRWNGSLVKMIQSNVKRKPKTWIQRLLKMALYELYFMNQAPHAVINEAVEICKQSKYKAQSNFVNAVLRQINYPAGVYANENFPDWLKNLWSQNGQWLKSLQKPPKSGVVFLSKTIPDSYKNLVERHCTIEGTLVPGVIYSTQKGPISTWQGYDDGEWWIMNPAAVHTVDFALSALPTINKVSALDMCAAPGGKTFRLKSRGISVVSMDISRSRLNRLEENAKRLGLSVDVIAQDATLFNPDLGTFDLVLLDAPCSGLGVIRKHPEIRWNRTLADVKSNALLQMRLLQTASRYVADNGRLVYCVCSLHPEEGDKVIHNFMEKNPDWQLHSEWKTPIHSSNVHQELLDGFQVYIFEKKINSDMNK